MLDGSQAEIYAQRNRKLGTLESSARFIGKRPRENDEPAFGVAGEADTFRIADKNEAAGAADAAAWASE